ncbi:DUF922 domain-containing protein [Sediminibacterium ginsengisoli]|uniref:DUF922 domain-containing protein n=1 Tax=Sediminibacterium ginsengisoli TaxID=413434 RepID=A0A1T4K201_9BACT|nr:DUF922 domain-containing protein [Sediminibacterium ginsengisoli]SJZ36444.1 protein of unknown function [Sediminibacterium ginsengisoli]
MLHNHHFRSYGSLVKGWLAGIVLLVSLTQANAQYVNDRIVWSDRKLTAKDFKQRFDTSMIKDEPRAVAHISTTIWFDYKETDKKELIFDVYAYFNPDFSWVKPGFRHDGQVMNHERFHFNLAELYARKVRKLLSTYTFNPDTYKVQIAAFQKKFSDEMRAQQKRYDEETVHGTKVHTQADWEDAIKRELEELDTYRKEKHMRPNRSLMNATAQN